jgi:hypothetical protein
MYNVDITLIKMLTDHYFIKRDRVVNKINFKNRLFFDRYERVDSTLTRAVMNDFSSEKIIVAHNLINSRDKVENIVFDYNGRNREKFWHRAQLLLREEGFLNFTAYESKSPGHLHLYLHKGHTTFTEAINLANNLSAKLSQKLPKEWQMFPTADLPREFNILNLPKKIYNKERGTSWAKHM